MGVVPPAVGYLQGVRELTSRHGALLIFDEVITGFRVAYGGAQALYGVVPDLTCLGKIIGGGLPVGAYGGRRDIMALVSPSGAVYQAGTLSGNPLAMTAGLATLSLLREPGAYERLETLGAALGEGLAAATRDAGVPAVSTRAGSMLTLFFTGHPVTDYATARAADTARYATFYRSMRGQGIYLAPSQFEATFVSLAHSADDVERTVAAARHALEAH
jgi:glutamate-1-semialdehyde 2,1-aminomutase